MLFDRLRYLLEIAKAPPKLNSLELLKAAVALTKQALRNSVKLELKPKQVGGHPWLYIDWIENLDGPGHGSDVLHILCDFADKHGVLMSLEVMGGRPQLVKLYESFGFIMSPKDRRAAMRGYYDDGGKFEDEPGPVMVRKPLTRKI